MLKNSVDKVYTLTGSQGQFLLMWAAGAAIPEKAGDMVFTSTDRAIIQSFVARLFDRLKAVSPWMLEYEPGKNMKLFFGPKENWQPEAAGGTRWFMKDPKLATSVVLEKDEVNGATWLLFLALAPRVEDARSGQAGGMAVSPSEAAETVWPLARLFGKHESLSDALGLKKYDAKRHAWNDDPAPMPDEVKA